MEGDQGETLKVHWQSEYATEKSPIHLDRSTCIMSITQAKNRRLLKIN